ncbi:hypothetical protein BaRGS_00018371, partial [Batillaria attramentaria]
NLIEEHRSADVSLFLNVHGSRTPQVWRHYTLRPYCHKHSSRQVTQAGTDSLAVFAAVFSLPSLARGQGRDNE